MNWILTQREVVWNNENQFLNYLRRKLPVYTTGSGPVTGATNGLTLVGPNIGLGGVTNVDNTIDMSINDNTIWFKGLGNPDGSRRTVTIGSLNTDSWNSHAGLLVSKSINDDFGRSTLLTLTNGDTTLNGFIFLNYQDTPGEILPNIRCASNAPAGQGAAFNLDLAARAGNTEFSQFSVFYYDYDQFVLHSNQAGPILNSNMLNFTNGTGGALSAQTVHFMWVDQNYNYMVGKNSWTDRPLGAFQIGDNAATYGLYQKGAASVNWLAGRVLVGGAATTTLTAWITPSASTTTNALLNLPVGPAPTSPASGDVWRLDDTNTGLKIRVGGVTKTITLS